MLDVDQDGDDDLILGPANGLTADVLLLNDGTGTFATRENAFPTRYQGTNGQTVNIATGDFNGDGLPDVIATTIDGRDASFSQSAKIHLYLNNGDASFSDGTNQITDNLIPVGWVEWVRVGDFNNDGNLDFVTTAPGGFGMDHTAGVFQGGFIYLNDGGANFARTVIEMDDKGVLGAYTGMVLAWDESAQGVVGRFPLDILAGDLDNDGDMDLVAPNGFSNGAWATFLNVSTGTAASFEVVLNDDVLNTNGSIDPVFWDRFQFKNGALLDINGDGFLDIVGSESIAGLGGGTVPILALVNDGTGKFSIGDGLITGPTPGVNHARQWLAADFDGDGLDDLLVADHGPDAFPFPGFPNTLLLNSGGSLSNSSSNLGSVTAFTHGAAVGDINNDGIPDIFMNNHQGLEGIGGATADNFIYLNIGGGVFSGAN